MKLIYEEFVIPLRESLKLRFENKPIDPRSMFFYKNVYSMPAIVNNFTDFKSITTFLHFDLEDVSEITWGDSKRLYSGNILFLSSHNDFRSFDAVCKIAFKKIKGNNQKSNDIRLNCLENKTIPVEIVSGYIKLGEFYYMVEPSESYRVYEIQRSALEKINDETFKNIPQLYNHDFK